MFKIVAFTEVSGYPIIQCHGVFDLLHEGHISYLQEAKGMIGKMGTLVVTVTSDRYVCKGENRPIIGENSRMKMLAALECVDYVCLSDFMNASTAIKIIKPNIFFKGSEYSDENMSLDEKFAIESIAGKLIYGTAPKPDSTTDIINRCKLV